ncbi:hypothetical protein [Haloferula sp. BvORR071]|uniref:hypothetical protein n=1 Tax=Haloferula sp. BvORR071 TaxID=1396141 RepID=UPI000550E3BD|nr:hypothetical protein [Haloferula sp. BvORR071]
MRLPLLFCALMLPVLSAQEVPPASDDKPPQPAEAAKDPAGPAAEGPKVVQVQVEMIEVSHEALTGLLFMRPKGSADATPLRQEIQEMVKTGKAKILETQIVTGRSGEKCSVESIQELIYPKEYEPAEIPNNLTLPEKVGEVNPEIAKALAGLVTPHNPSAFESRNVGSTLEIEPTTDATGKLIDLRFAPNLVWHTGNTIWQERKDVLGNELKIEEPEFYSLRATTALTMKDGAYSLAAVLSPKDQEGHADMERKVMMFVKCDVLSVR